MRDNDKAECLAPGALAGKTIWITGGGSGLGKAMALRFGALGAKLALSGRRTEPLAETVAAIQAGLPGASEELHAALLRRSESPRA